MAASPQLRLQKLFVGAGVGFLVGSFVGDGVVGEGEGALLGSDVVGLADGDLLGSAAKGKRRHEFEKKQSRIMLERRIQQHAYLWEPEMVMVWGSWRALCSVQRL